jgi:hypothetical protein
MTDKTGSPIKRNVKKKIFPIGSMPPLVSAFSPPLFERVVFLQAE